MYRIDESNKSCHLVFIPYVRDNVLLLCGTVGKKLNRRKMNIPLKKSTWTFTNDKDDTHDTK